MPNICLITDQSNDPCDGVIERAEKYYEKPLKDFKLRADAFKLNPDWLPGETAADIPPPGIVLGCMGKKKKSERGMSFL